MPMNDAAFKKLMTNLRVADVMLAKVERVVTITTKRLEGLAGAGELQSLRLQMAMDRMSKLMSTLSNILKKMSSTTETIAQNIK